MAKYEENQRFKAAVEEGCNTQLDSSIEQASYRPSLTLL